MILDHGRVVAAGTLDELRAGAGSDAAPEVRFGAPAGLMVTELATHLGARCHRGGAGRVPRRRRGHARAGRALTAWLADRDLPLGDLRAGRQRLEDVFLRLVDRRDRPA